MNGRKLINILGKKFPKRIAKNFHDYVGLMAGKIPDEVHKILVCLDYDYEVHDVAKTFRPDLILTHHPFIYGHKSLVLKEDEVKKALYDEVNKEGFNIYSFHTNFDEPIDGMNDALTDALKLNDVYHPDSCPMMRIGYLSSAMNREDFARYAKECLKVNYGLLLPYGSPMVQKVGIIGGGGNGDYVHAIKEGCDIYISGDAPHHIRRDIIARHFNYLDLPHEIEKIFIYQMKKILLDIDSGFELCLVDHEKEPTVI